MLFTILEYLQNIFYNLFATFLEAHPHNAQEINQRINENTNQASNKETELHGQSKKRDTEMARFLTGNSEKIDEKNLNLKVTIRLAVSLEKETLLEFLAKKGENEISMLDTELHIGYTVLHIAAMRGYTQTASFLIKIGAKIDSKTLTGKTPLYMAAMSGYTETASFLFENGANVDAKNTCGETLLHMAAKSKSKNYNAIELLIQKGANVNELCRGESALFVAAENGDEKLAKNSH